MCCFNQASVRSLPEFKQEARAWVKAVKTGIDPNPQRPHPLGKAFSWLSYLLRHVWFEANKSSSLIKRDPPLRPGAGPQVKFTGIPADLKQNRPPSDGFQFFGQADIDGASGTLTVALKDLDGKTLFTQEITPES